MPRKTTKSKEYSPALPEEQSSDVIIANDGDIFLEIRDSRAGVDCRYRCSRTVLSSKSEYFNVLFDPVKFSEGRATETKLHGLSRQYSNLASIPPSKLPSVAVSDVGDLPKDCVLTSTVVRQFLKILHDPTTPWPAAKPQSIEFVALLAIIADRLAAIRCIKDYLREQRIETTLLKERKAATAHQLELDNRQRLLAGFRLGFASWIRQCSAALITEGPKRQTTTKMDSSDDEVQDDDALWWRLPNGVEGTRLHTMTEARWPTCYETKLTVGRRARLPSRLRPRYPKLHPKALHQPLHQKAPMPTRLRFLAGL